MYAFIGGMGYGEMLLVFFIAALLFGNRLSEVFRHMDGSIREFRNGMFYERRWSRCDRYEAEKQVKEFARLMDRFGRAVALVIGVVLVGVILAYLFRELGLF